MISTQETPTRDRVQAKSGSRAKVIGAGAVVFLALAAAGALPRIASYREALAATNEAPVTHPVVSVIHATKGEPTSQLVLPGNIEPLYTANLYARVDGYLDRRNVDIGTKVRAGQVLAVISSPEIDQQLSQAKATLAQSQAALLQARAALEQAKANAELARLTRERDVPLGEQHAISQQIVDSAVQNHNARVADVSAAGANIAAAEASVAANQANVARLQQMQNFERIVAPFDGVITQRNVERGDLVNASAQNRPLFSIAQSDTLRIYVDVPQSEAVNIRDGQKASIDVTERLGRDYTGTVTRNASALNDAARTMRTEVQVDNHDASLLPGMYAQVHFTLSQQHTSLIVPTSSLVIDHAGMHVVTVDAGQKVHFVPVTIGKDMGKEVEVLAGLNGSESLVASPGDLLSEGNMSNSAKSLLRGAGIAVLGGMLALLVAGCKVGPDYKRPDVVAPQSYRGALAPELTAEPVAQAAPQTSIAEQDWQNIFTDPALQAMIAEALKNNLDLKIAAQRVLEAQSVVGIVRSQQLPSVNAGGSFSALQLPQGLAPQNSDGTKNDFIRGGGFSASAAWNLDFWGYYRRQTEAARAELLQTEWAQRATRTALIQQLAASYFQLRSLDSQLEITKNTIQAREDSLRLTQSLENYGAGSRADTRQAEELLYTAKANLPELRRQIAAQENAISVLLGHAPQDVARGQKIEEQPHPAAVPTGLPSELLERRPDIRQAEATLIAANARVGVAKAQFFPQISLTSMGGSASNQLQKIFDGGNAYWYAAGSLSQPIFAGGRIRSNYKYSQAQQQEMVVQYQKAILNALKDVSNSLTAYKETQSRREEQTRAVASAADAVRLARLRYAGGNTSYIEVLATDTNLYDAQLQLAQAQSQEANSLVQLYAALGGGWK